MKYKINEEVTVTSIKDTIFTTALVGVRVRIVALRPENDAYLVSIPGLDLQVTIKEDHLSSATRSLSMIARDIRTSWKPVHYSAAPYLNAMLSLDSINGGYGNDSARSVVSYFLSNSTTWRGEKARSIKAELRKMMEVR